MKKSALLLTSFIVGVFALGGVSGVILANAASNSPEALLNVQISVHPSTSNLSSYTLDAYNSSGYIVASSTSKYPGFGLELPSGTYLFTVMASQYTSYYPVPYASSMITATAGAPTSQLKTLIPQGLPAIEYGYLLTQVSGPSTYNISTSSLYNITTSKIVLHVAYANGTVAQGVSVQGSVVGAGYYYGGINSNTVMWNQTASDGSATLTVPNVPIEVSAWTWIPVNLPKNDTTVQVTVGGQPVNVTVYWSPTYVGLAGSQLIMPPTTSANIKLQAQQPNYWVMPYGVQSSYASGDASVPQSTLANSPGGVPASQYQGTASNNVPPQQISPITAVSTTTATTTIAGPTLTTDATTTSLIELLAAAVVVAVVLSAVGIVIALRKKM